MTARGQFGRWAIVAIVASGLWPAILAWAETPTPKVIINELAWAGSTLSANDEWIELMNGGAEPVDVSGWQITKNTGTEALMVTIPTGQTIEPGGYFLIANFDESNSVLAIAPNMVDPAVTLSNDKLQIKLYQGDWTMPDNLVDTVGDGGVPPAGNSSAKSSMERSDDGVNWHDAMARVNLDADVTDLGTPGAANSTPVEPLTITAITPNRADTGSQLKIEGVTGTGFASEPLPSVELRLADQTIAATDVQVANPSLIDGGQFNLTGAETGRWDLVITNPNGQTATLSQAVEITEPPEQYDLTATVRLNEIYPQPNTTSNDEYIELYNFGDKTVNLKGWVLDDARDDGSSPYELADRLILPKAFLAIYKSESKLTLNDSGDSVYLIQPNGFELDRTSYVTAPRGQTWARFDDGWQWTSSPTPNGKNVLAQPPAPPAKPMPPIDEPDDTAVFAVGSVIVTELLPNPVDDEEFIELQNVSSTPIDLTGWTLRDKSKHQYRISQFAVNLQTTSGLTIQPQQYVVITDTMSGIALNNTGGEVVTLIDPNDQVIATASYPDKAPTGAAYALADGQWTWSRQPTPGTANALGLDEADEPPPNVDIVLPTTLPITGAPNRRWLGRLLVALSAGAIVGLNYVGRHHAQFGRNPSLGGTARSQTEGQ